MAIIFLGISFVVQAFLHYFGLSYMVAKKYREYPFRKQFQRGIVLPYTLLGAGWTVLGLTYRTFQEQDSPEFCLRLILITIIPAILLIRNKRKHQI